MRLSATDTRGLRGSSGPISSAKYCTSFSLNSAPCSHSFATSSCRAWDDHDHALKCGFVVVCSVDGIQRTLYGVHIEYIRYE